MIGRDQGVPVGSLSRRSSGHSSPVYIDVEGGDVERLNGADHGALAVISPTESQNS